MVNFIKTTKYGMEVWLVSVNGQVVGQAMSEQGARSIWLDKNRMK